MRRRELSLTDRLAALREAVELAEDRLEVPEVGRARALLGKAGAREALGDATVVALAGATGSGKSTLFNALVGADVSTPGVRRPTTGVAHAAVWGSGPADVYVVGTQSLHFNGTNWTEVNIETSSTLHDVAGVSGRRVWAVGEGGTVMRGRR